MSFVSQIVNPNNLTISQPLNSNTVANINTPFYGGSAPPSGGVTSIIAGSNVTISPTTGIGAVTINASGGSGGGVTSIIAGSNITIDPIDGTGAVTINARGGGAGVFTSIINSGATTLDGGATISGGVIVQSGNLAIESGNITNNSGGLAIGGSANIQSGATISGGVTIPTGGIIINGGNVAIDGAGSRINVTTNAYPYTGIISFTQATGGGPILGLPSPSASIGFWALQGSVNDGSGLQNLISSIFWSDGSKWYGSCYIPIDATESIVIVPGDAGGLVCINRTPLSYDFVIQFQPMGYNVPFA